MLSDIGGLVAVTNQQLNADVEFALRKLNDLRLAYTFGATYSPQSLGVGASALYKFGTLVTPLLYSDVVEVSVAYDRLRASFDKATPGDLVSLGVAYGHDDRMSPYYGFRGNGISLSSGVSYGHDTSGRDYAFGALGAASEIYQVAFGHALVGRLRGDILVGTVPKQAELRLGGRYFGGRGYEANEATATRRAIASFEYRHLLEGDMRSDFGRVFMFTRIEGALFADAIAMPVHRAGCNQDVFTDVGYGLRFIGDILNVRPSTLNVDFGVPLNRCQDQRYRVPFAVYVSFLQSFAAF